MADGSIVIDTKIDDGGFVEGINKMSSKQMRLTNSIKKTEMELSKMRSRMAELANTKIPTQEYAEIQAHLQKAEAEFDKLIEKQDIMIATGRNSGSAWDTLQLKLEQAGNAIRADKQDMDNLVQSGQAFTIGSSTTEFETLRDKAGMLQEKLNADNAQLNEMHNKFADVKEAGTSAFNSVYGTMQKIDKKINGLISRFLNLHKTGKSSMDAINNSAKGTSSILKTITSRLRGLALSMLLFNWISKAFSAVTSGVKNGYQELAKYDAVWNRTMSNIKAATTQLQGNIASAFSNLVNLIAPAITYIINLLSTAVTYISMFFAALSGKTTIKKATTSNNNYADSIAGAGSAASDAADDIKKANKQLAAFDELNNTTTTQKDENKGTGGSGNGGGFDLGYTDVPIDNKILDFLDKVKKVLADLFEPLKKAWDKVGPYIKEDFAKMCEALKKLAAAIWDDFITVWKQDATVAVFENLLWILDDILKVVTNLADRFREAWQSGETGLHIFENIRDVIAVLVQHVKNMADATVDWSANLNFEPLLDAIELLTSKLVTFADFVGGVAEDIYTNFFLPLSKWAVEVGIPQFMNIISDFIDKVDWDTLRSNLNDLWTHLEPFAEKIGEGLLLFLEDFLDCVAKIINSNAFQYLIDKFIEFIDNMTAEDVKNVLEGITVAIIAFKVAMLGLSAISGINATMSTITTFLGWFGTNGAASATAISGISTALGYLATAAVGLGVFEAIKDPVFDLCGKMFDLGDITDTVKEKYDGLGGTFTLIGDSCSAVGQKIGEFFTGMPVHIDGLTNSTDALYKTMQLAGDGTTYNIEKLMQLENEYELTDQDIDSLIQTMIDYNDSIDLSKLGLEGYAGDFESFRAQQGLTTDSTKYLTDTTEAMTKTYEDGASRIKTATETAATSTDTFASSAKDSLSNVDSKVTETGSTFDTLSSDVSSNLNDTSGSMETWYTDSTSKYFDKNKWAELAGNISIGIKEGITQFTQDWEVIMTDWWENSVNVWFGYDKWNLISTTAMQALSDGFTTGWELVNTNLLNFLLTMETTIDTNLLTIQQQINLFNITLNAMTDTFFLTIRTKYTNFHNITYKALIQNMELVRSQIQNFIITVENILSTRMAVILSRWRSDWAQMVSVVKQACQEIISQVDEMASSISEACSGALSELTSLSSEISGMKMPTFSFGSFKADGGIFTGSKWKAVQNYASGGFPLGSQLFWAREAGPELVGTIGGHTAVVNNDQIVASVASGVQEALLPTLQALAAVLNNLGSGGNVVVEIDGEPVFTAVREQNTQLYKQTGENAW